MILSDSYLSLHYRESYGKLLGLAGSGPGPTVEIGCGPGFVKRIDPTVITSDVEIGASADLAADAARLPFPDSSLRALILKDALHHLPDVEAFLDESSRVLRPGGVIAVLDPYWGPLAKAVYKWLHPEPFDPSARTWQFESSSPHHSNQALLWILLRRDRDRFERRFPCFEILEHGPTIGPSFLLSGGLYGRTPLPSRLLELMWKFEHNQGRWLDPLRFGYVVALRKKDS
jgi:SAM-dependent methyltransferase